MLTARNDNQPVLDMKKYAGISAHFSLIAYNEKEVKYILPVGYKQFCVCPEAQQENDYYGESYYHINPDESVTIVITHRGTVLSLDNIFNDIKVALGSMPPSFKSSAIPFTRMVVAEAQKQFVGKTCHFIHTGHSLGAILAELSFAYHHSHLDENVYAISFESPGSLPLLQDAIDKNLIQASVLALKDRVEIYNGDINLINSHNPHFKTPHNIDLGYTFDDELIDLFPTFVEYFYTSFTKSQHSIVKIYKHFTGEDSKIYRLADYPVGRQEAFEYYMTFNKNPAHQRYWEEVIKHYWDTHDDTQTSYDNKFADFRSYVIDQLTRIQQTFGFFAKKDQPFEKLDIRRANFEI